MDIKIKFFILRGLYYLYFFNLLRVCKRNKVIILMYHRFSSKTEPFKVCSEVFERQLVFLKKKYNIISLEQFNQALAGRVSIPGNSVVLTFDDGYADNYYIAYPILKKYSVPATIFLTTDFISHKIWLWSNKLEYILKNSARDHFVFPLGSVDASFSVDSFENWHSSQLRIFNYLREMGTQRDLFLDELASYLNVKTPHCSTTDFLPLTWSQIKEMYQNNMTFGSHTCTHPILSTIHGEHLKKEIVSSKKEIENHLLCEISSFCYPNGQLTDFNANVVRLVKAAGYLSAVTTEVGYNDIHSTNHFLLKRLSIKDSNNIVIARTLTRNN